MTDKAKVLEFLRRSHPSESPPDPNASFYGLYPLNREDGVMLSLPLFELILLHLLAGTDDAKELAAVMGRLVNPSG